MGVLLGPEECGLLGPGVCRLRAPGGGLGMPLGEGGDEKGREPGGILTPIPHIAMFASTASLAVICKPATVSDEAPPAPPVTLPA